MHGLKEKIPSRNFNTGAEEKNLPFFFFNNTSVKFRC